MTCPPSTLAVTFGNTHRVRGPWLLPAQRAESLVGAAGSFARWASRTGTGIARRIPGAAAVESELGQLERVVLTELRRRLDNVDPIDDRRPGDEPVDNPTRNPPPPRQTEPLRVAMAEVLMRSLEQSTQRARKYLYAALLRQLVPDEARILSALADGSVYPLVHVDIRTGVSGSRRLLSNASSVRRAAGVAVPNSVPRYVQRLLHFDLVELGEHDLSLTVQYDILMTDQTLRDAEEQARTEGRARFVRRTLRIARWDATSGTPATRTTSRTPGRGPTPRGTSPPTPSVARGTR